MKNQERRLEKSSLLIIFSLQYPDLCAFYLTGAQTSGAYINVAGRTLYDCLDALYIGFPGSVGRTMGMGNLIAECNAFAAD